MQENIIEIFYPTSQAEWRQWLQEHHRTNQSVWLVQYTKASAKPTISWSEAVDEALCFGWIDSKKVSIDNERTHQFFSKRKAKSTWSKINKNKVERLIADGLMTEIGLHSIETAKQNGSWSILDDAEALQIPHDLAAAFENSEGANDFFISLSKSVKKNMLQWIILAKRPETRQKRIDEIAEFIAQKQKPSRFR